eukprot:gnl/MRDRNA2_/MRDRNA2_218162_c0_seq1.p1 gnl/MRDRNA2_/MRDRNA2_218162_c0~~gnl/MRDRNA2_/MRDRNA2_218162_c0_seq1.p1  ORF type:complete len:171 (-),score=17.25 gnl/MRDRNA2_/MRDRNA2_218162_c0_seq1:109-621(-)
MNYASLCIHHGALTSLAFVACGGKTGFSTNCISTHLCSGSIIVLGPYKESDARLALDAIFEKRIVCCHHQRHLDFNEDSVLPFLAMTTETQQLYQNVPLSGMPGVSRGNFLQPSQRNMTGGTMSMKLNMRWLNVEQHFMAISVDMLPAYMIIAELVLMARWFEWKSNLHS